MCKFVKQGRVKFHNISKHMLYIQSNLHSFTKIGVSDPITIATSA